MKLTAISLVFSVVLSVMWSEASIGSPRVFVLFGGFGSCALSGDPGVMTMAPQFQDAVAQATINDSQDPLFYQACYAVGSGTLFYQRPDGQVIRGNRASLVAELAKIAKPKSLNLIGQSHGGWTALVVALEAPVGTVDTIVSIDPISVRECSSGSWLASSTAAAFGFGPAAGCTSYPSDLLIYSKSIKSRANTWINFWQEEYSLLHSGPVDAAAENINLIFDDWSWHPMGAHAETETSEIVWNRAIALWSK